MPSPDPDVRQRLLLAAERCFYRSGITASGVDALAEEAGVSKRTLYNQFGSKEGLVAAYLEMREQRWQAKLAPLLAAAGSDPMERVLAYLRGYAMAPPDDVFRGCALINAAAELAGPDDPALALVQQSIARVEREIGEIMQGAGVPADDAARVAASLLVVLEGAIAVGGIRRNQDQVLAAATLVRQLVQPALDAVPSPA